MYLKERPARFGLVRVCPSWGSGAPLTQPRVSPRWPTCVHWVLGPGPCCSLPPQRPQRPSPEVTACPSKGKQSPEGGMHLLQVSGGRDAEGKAPAQQGVPLLDTPKVIPTLCSEAQALAWASGHTGVGVLPSQFVVHSDLLPARDASHWKWGEQLKDPIVLCPQGPWSWVGGPVCPNFLRLVGGPPESTRYTLRGPSCPLLPGVQVTWTLPDLLEFPKGKLGSFFVFLLSPPSLAHSRCSINAQ